MILVSPGQAADGAPPGVLCLYPGGGVSHFSAQFGGGAPAGIPLRDLLAQGYTVLLAEAPLTPEGQPGQPLAQLSDVVLPQLHHAAERGLVDLNRVAIAGHSYGASLSGLRSKMPLRASR